MNTYSRIWLPIERLALRTRRPAGEVIAIVKARTSPESGWLGFLRRSPDDLFVGDVSDTGMAVRLNRLSASSVRPQFVASIVDENGSTSISGRLCLYLPPIALMALGLAGFAWGAGLPAIPIGIVVVLASVLAYRRERNALISVLEERVR